MTHVRNIDDLINSIPEAQPIVPTRAAPEPKEQKEVSSNDDFEREQPEKEERKPRIEPEIVEKSEKEPPTREKLGDETQKTEKNDSQKAESDQDTDEYGNEVVKQKTYTEEQVQKMIRDRLSRGQFKEQQPTQQQAEQAKNAGFEYNANSDLTWSDQLKVFVKEAIQEVSQDQVRQQQEYVKRQAEAEFESKMFSGMAKYPDFVNVLSETPVSDAMVMGIRGLDNPAAFLYAAAKRHPEELSRIGKISDPYQQAAEMGRLHDRIAKAKRASSAPRPITPDRSDVSEKVAPKYSIDHLIHEHARDRYKR